MALLVGEIQANITADGSKYVQELGKAKDAGKQFRSDAEKPVEINGDGKPAIAEIGKVDSAAGNLVKSVSGKPAVIKADDKATPVIRKIDGETLSSKDVALSVDDKASPAINKIKGEQIPGKKVPVEVEDDTGPGTERIGSSLTKWAAGLGLGAIIGKGIAVGMEKGDARTSLQNQMGTLNADAKEYGIEAGDVYAQGFADSMEQANTAVSAASSNFADFANMSKRAREQITGDGVKIANVFGEEVSPVMAAAGSLVANKVTPDIQTAMDTITAGLQGAANKGEDVLDTFTEYSPFFHRLGLDGAESLGFLNSAILAGARNSDIAADAIKEFSLRAIDGSTLTAQGFTEVGLNADDMSAKIAAGGSTAHDAFLLTLKSLQDMDDQQQRNQAGVALFGSQWEDALRDALPAMDLTKLKMDGIAGTTDRLQLTSGQWVDSLKTKVANALPVLTQATVAMAALPTVAGMAASGWGFAKDKLGSLTERLGESVPLLSGMGSGARRAAAGAEGAAASGGRLAGVMSKLGAGLSVVGGAAIPVAAGFGIVGVAWELAAEHQQDLIDQGDSLGAGLAKGGEAAKKAATQINDLNTQIGTAQKRIAELAARDTGPGAGYSTYGGNNHAAGQGKQTELQSQIQDQRKIIDEAKKSYADLVAELGPVGLAQARVTQAQKDYNNAVMQFGPNSAEATSAQQSLAIATAKVATEQNAAATAAKTNTQALYDQQQQIKSSLTGVYNYQSSMLALDQANTSAAEAEKNLDKVQKNRHHTAAQLTEAQNGVKSAQLQQNQAILQSIDAFVAQRVAESGATTDQERAKVAMNAQNEAVINLAKSFKGPLPDALRKTIGNMTDAQLAALGCTTTVDRLGNKIVTMPNGKKIKLSAEDQATPTINAVKSKLTQITSKTWVATLKVQGGGALIGHAGDVGMNAKGTDNWRGGLTVVGEEGPELVYLPKGSQIIPNDKTRDMMKPGRGNHTMTTTSTSSTVDHSRHTVNHIYGVGMKEVARELEDRAHTQDLLYS